MIQQEVDVTVVGAGILGIAHAYHCLVAGFRVTLIEKNAYPKHATHRNFGQIVPSGMDTFWQRYGIKSLRLYKELKHKAKLPISEAGSFYVASDGEESLLIQELHQINDTNGYRSQLLSKEECLRANPSMSKDYVQMALFYPEEISVDPNLIGKALIDYMVEQMGLTYLPHHLAIAVSDVDSATIVECSNRVRIKSKKVIVCNGSDFQTLFPDLFLQSDIQKVKLQMLETVPQLINLHGNILTGWTIRRYEAFRQCPSFAEIASKSTQHKFKEKYGIHLLFKQSPDGSVIIGDSHEYTDLTGECQFSYDSDNNINRYLISKAQYILELDDWSIKRIWNGYYSQCKDADIYQKSIDDNIVICTAIGGKGMTASLGYAAEHVNNIFSLSNSIV